jgi:iron complex transport system substrate-binding protein
MKKWLPCSAPCRWWRLLRAGENCHLGGDVTEIVCAWRGSRPWWRATAPASGRRRRTLPDVGYLRQLNAEGILSMRPRWCWPAQAQPSLALKQVEQSHVRVTVPAATT